MRVLPGLAALAALAACAGKPAKENPLPVAAPAAVSAAAEAAGVPGAHPDPAAAADPPAPGTPAARAAIGDFGLDLSAGDRSVRPGDDFFAYASGTWYGSFVIPADHSSFGPFNALEELSTQRVRAIIEAAAAAHPAVGTPEQQIGDYYASFMDEQATEANGSAPEQAHLKRSADAK